MKRRQQRPEVIYRPGVDDPAEDEKQPAPRFNYDPHHPPTAGINRYREPQMAYEDAMRLKEAGELIKPTLTEKGWVTP